MTPDTDRQTRDTQAQRLEQVYEHINSLLHEQDVIPHLGTAPSDQAWSALHVIGHLVEMIPYWLQHCHRLIAATGTPPQFGRTLDAPERLAGVAAATTSDAHELLRQLQRVVETAATEIRHMTEEQRSKTGIHVRQGSMSVADVIEQLIVGHAEAHVIQVQDALKR